MRFEDTGAKAPEAEITSGRQCRREKASRADGATDGSRTSRRASERKAAVDRIVSLEALRPLMRTVDLEAPGPRMPIPGRAIVRWIADDESAVKEDVIRLIILADRGEVSFDDVASVLPEVFARGAARSRNG